MGLKYEYIQHTNPDGSISHRIKMRDNVNNEDNIFRMICDVPIDEPLCEIIEEFGIPVIRLEGYKWRYVSTAEICKKLGLKKNKLNYPQKIVKWIHPRESITKLDYKTQVARSTQLTLLRGGRPLTLVSLGDAIQILAVLQKDKERGKLIRRLIVKIEELQKEIRRKENEELKNLEKAFEKLDIIAYDFIKEHSKSSYYEEGYNLLWGNTIWNLIIQLKRRKNKVLGLPIPIGRNTGLHHPDRPYTRVYPKIATRGFIIDKRWKHEDPRQERFFPK